MTLRSKKGGNGMHLSMRCPREGKKSRDMLEIRPVFKSSIWKMGPAPGRFELSKGI